MDDFRLDRISSAWQPETGNVVLLGPSGAGKTVLLEIIAGIRDRIGKDQLSTEKRWQVYSRNTVVQHSYTRIIRSFPT